MCVCVLYLWVCLQRGQQSLPVLLVIVDSVEARRVDVGHDPVCAAAACHVSVGV